MQHGGIALPAVCAPRGEGRGSRAGPRQAQRRRTQRGARHTGLGPTRCSRGRAPAPQACDLSASLTLVAQSTLVLSTVRGGSLQCPRDADGRAVCALALVKRLRKSRWLKSILYLRLCFGSSRSLLFQQ